LIVPVVAVVLVTQPQEPVVLGAVETDQLALEQMVSQETQILAVEVAVLAIMAGRQETEATAAPAWSSLKSRHP
jgi:hypothetical protein